MSALKLFRLLGPSQRLQPAAPGEAARPGAAGSGKKSTSSSRGVGGGGLFCLVLEYNINCKEFYLFSTALLSHKSYFWQNHNKTVSK